LISLQQVMPLLYTRHWQTLKDVNYIVCIEYTSSKLGQVSWWKFPLTSPESFCSCSKLEFCVVMTNIM
jgi:hypothetical protein